MSEVFYLVSTANTVVGTTVQEEEGYFKVTWNDDEGTTSEFDDLSRFYDAVLSQGIRVADEDDGIVKLHLYSESLKSTIKQNEEEIAEYKEQTRELKRKVRECRETNDESVEYLIEALRDTVDYIGSDKLPPVGGKPWYDAIAKFRPNLAAYWKSAHDQMKSVRTEYSVESQVEDNGMDPETTKDLLHLQNQVRELEIWLANILSEPREEQVDREETLLETVQRAMGLVQTAGSPSISQAALQRSLQDLLESSKLVPAKDGLYTENVKGAYVFKFR